MSSLYRYRMQRSRLVALIVLTVVGCSSTGVTDTPVPVATLDVSPPTLSLNVGQSQTITATPKSASGKSLTARAVQWASSAANIAAVNGSGVVSGVAPGTATITASSGEASRTISVTVIQAFTFTVTGGGNGNGTVNSAPGGISCTITNGTAGTTGCSASFSAGSSVSIIATPAAGSTVGGWGGVCAGTVGATCTTTMSTARAATVFFSRVGSSPPAVTTGIADQITSTSARLNGSIAQDGNPYTIWFEFGTNSTLTNANTTSAGNGPNTNCPGTSTCVWSSPLPSLQPNTTYFYRVVSDNAFGRSFGAIRSFATP